MKLTKSSFNKIFLTLSAAVVFSMTAHAQGCSDAGFCTLGAMDGGTTHREDSKYSLNLVQTFEAAADEVFVYKTKLRTSLYLSSSSSLELTLPFTISNGPLGSLQHVGDPSLVWVNQWTKESEVNFKTSLGIKLPSNQADLTDDLNRFLPMVYQPSLGTYDALVGVSFNLYKISISAGSQIVLNSINSNQYTPLLFDPNLTKPANSYANPIRKSDLLLRLNRGFELSETNTISGGILALYHLGEDEYENLLTQEFETIEGSDGLTLNLNFGYTKSFENNQELDLGIAFPIITRDTQPFGLVRSFVFSIGYSFDR